MADIANALLVSTTGSLLMQHRDDKPNISNPNKITAFASAIEKGETIKQAIVREIQEETNLRPSAADFQLFGTYQKVRAIHGDNDTVHYFILSDVYAAELRVFEGQGFVEVRPDNVDAFDFSILADQVVRDYFKL